MTKAGFTLQLNTVIDSKVKIQGKLCSDDSWLGGVVRAESVLMSCNDFV